MQTVLLCGLLMSVVTASVFDEYFSDVCTYDGFYSIGSCYRFLDKLLNWTDAEAECVKSSGHLAQIDSQQEQTWMEQELNKRKYDLAWLGGYDQFRNRTWRWISNGEAIDSSTSFINWGRGEPNNQGVGEYCMNVHRYSNYTWNDLACSRSLHAVCETRFF